MKHLSFFQNKAEVYIIENSEFIRENNLYLSNYESILSPSELEKYKRYIAIDAKYTFLTARIFLRKLISQKLELNSPSQVNISIAENGKPYLKDYPEFQFNMSHTKGLVIIGFAKNPIGVDVEKTERESDYENIVKHFFSEKEKESLFSLPKDKQERAFYVGWTRKEAFLKVSGDGLSKMKNNELSFDPETSQPIISNNGPDCLLEDFIPMEGYQACVCMRV